MQRRQIPHHRKPDRLAGGEGRDVGLCLVEGTIGCGGGGESDQLHAFACSVVEANVDRDWINDCRDRAPLRE
jgi:hypothetical protein